METTLQFTADIKKEDFDILEKHIIDHKDLYCITKYVLGQENYDKKGLPKEHFHFVITYGVAEEFAHTNQVNLVKGIVDKWKLSTKRKEGQRGGKNKYANGSSFRLVKNLDNCISYITKENNYRYFNYDKEYIELRQSQSFIKDPETSIDYVLKLKQNALEYFDKHFEDQNLTIYSYNNILGEKIATPIRPPSPNWDGSIVKFGPRDHASEIKKFIYYYIRDQTDTNLKSFSTIKSVSFYVVNKSDKISEDLRFTLLEAI